MKIAWLVTLLAAAAGDASASAFYAYADVTPYNVPTAPPAAVLSDNNATGLPADGLYTGAIDYTTGPITAFDGTVLVGSGRASINIDLRAGTFQLTESAYLPPYCVRYTICFDVGTVTTTVGFAYTDTLSIRVPGAGPSDVGYVEFDFQTWPNFLSSAFPRGAELVASSIGLVNDSPSHASSASVLLNRGCYGLVGCSYSPSFLLSYDAAAGALAKGIPASQSYYSPDFLGVRVPIYGEYSELTLNLALSYQSQNACVNCIPNFAAPPSLLTVATSPGVHVMGTDGYLLNPRIVPEPDEDVLLIGGLFAAWRARRQRTLREQRTKKVRRSIQL